ncbi:MAG: hypothetical protein IT455_17130 [Planctomycetes bacterium]|nr:hypothetical protein [Planctomycetota bacterium]
MSPPAVAASPSPSPSPSSSSPPAAAGWSARSDHLNAILVREVQQAVKGRAFAMTILIALTVVIVVATRTMGRARYATTPGREVFDAGLALLAPLILFVVPMQAFQSMRLELRSGIVEQLLLTRLSPRAILTGKLQAAMVQFVLYVSLLSPLLATSYLLRGIDLPTIGLTMVFGFVMCLVATAFAVSSAAQAMLPSLQAIANLATALGLGILTVMTMAFVASSGYSRAMAWWWSSGTVLPVASGIVLLAMVTMLLSLLVARCHLLHAFENRSTGFRALLFVCLPLAVAWVFACNEARHRGSLLLGLGAGLLVVGAAFALFLVTEPRALSVRVRAHVPANGLAALLASPFLPGRDRGLLSLLLFFILLVPMFLLGSTLASSSLRAEWGLRFLALGSTYTMIYAALLHWLRGRLPETQGGSHTARFLAPVLIAAACIVPTLVDVFVRGEVDDWHVGHALNPFWTINHLLWQQERWSKAMPVVLLVLVAVVTWRLPAMLRGVAEVQRAASARRRGQIDA